MAETGKGSGIPEAGFKTNEQLEAWLKVQPREVAIAIAWRSAARVFPMIIGGKPYDVILLVLRAIAVSRFAAVWPNYKSEALDEVAIAISNETAAILRYIGIAGHRRDPAAAQSAPSPTNVLHAARTAVSAVSIANPAQVLIDRVPNAIFDSIWLQITLDAELCEERGIEALNEAPIWFKLKDSLPVLRPPNWARDGWERLRSELEDQPQEHCWFVWIDWYNDILFGKPGPTRNRDMEFARLFGHPDAGIEITKDDWKAGPSVVNPKIRQVLDWFHAQSGNAADTPNVPPQSPAPVEAAVIEERIVRVEIQPSRMSRDVLATHSVLRSETIALADRCKGQLPDASAALNNCHAALGDTLGSANVFEVGYWAEVLRAMSSRVDESILDDGAGRFAGLIINLDRFLRQFAEWNEYVSRAAGAEISDAIGNEQAANAAQAVVQEVAAHEQVVDRSVINPLDALYRAMADGMQYNPETAYGFYRSLSNVIQVISQVTLDALPEKTRRMLREAVSKGAVDEFLVDCLKSVRSGAIKSTAAIGVAILATASSALLVLAGVMPNIFGWVPAVLRFLGLA